jgi:hypothetical protein
MLLWEHPSRILAEGGLRPALRTLDRRSPIPGPPPGACGKAVARAVSAYYVVCEALTNAAKHAHASALMAVTVAVEILRVSVATTASAAPTSPAARASSG